MKKTILSLLMLTLYFINLNGQINKGINFQGVARSDNGIILANKIVTLRLSIKTDSANGVIEYQEIKSITFENWTAGRMESGSGTVFVIELEKPLGNTIRLEKIYFKNLKKMLEH